ncbi:MAG: zf-HC2 domain-containing protein [Actinobacteria bacterium]|nr:zf-HC2 domain-containing protein [Actinomycetota bacterium]
MKLTTQRCDRVRAWVSVELDGELSQFEIALLRTHLAGCEDCRKFAAEARAFTGELRSAPPERLDVPISLPRRRRGSFRSVQVAVAASAVAAVGLGSVLGSLGSRDAITARSAAPSTLERVSPARPQIGPGLKRAVELESAPPTPPAGPSSDVERHPGKQPV